MACLLLAHRLERHPHLPMPGPKVAHQVQVALQDPALLFLGSGRQRLIAWAEQVVGKK